MLSKTFVKVSYDFPSHIKEKAHQISAELSHDDYKIFIKESTSKYIKWFPANFSYHLAMMELNEEIPRVGAVVAFITHKDKVLITRQSKRLTHTGEDYSFSSAGLMDYPFEGNPIIYNMRKELEEELHISMDELLLYKYKEFSFHRWHTFGFAFESPRPLEEILKVIPLATDSWEIAEAKVVKKDELSSYAWRPHTRAFLEVLEWI